MEISCKVKLNKGIKDYYVTVLENNDKMLFDKLVSKNSEYYICNIKTPLKNKSYSQVKTIWKLIEIIFMSQEFRKPTEEEKKNLCDDLLDEYGMKRLNVINKKLVPIRISQSDTKACSYFIEGLILHLANYCDLTLKMQTDVKVVIQDWYNYYNTKPIELVENCTVEEYRERHVVSEASCLGGDLHLHHIITKGSDERLRNCTANWLMLTVEEHNQLHNYGEDYFLKKYPHLVTKFNRIKKYQQELNSKGGINYNGRK